MKFRQNFFHKLAIAETFEELFIPTLNRIVADVQYVPSTPVILYARLNDQLRRMQTNMMMKNEKETKDSYAFSQVEHKHENPVAAFTKHALTTLLHMLQWSMQANRKIHLC